MNYLWGGKQAKNSKPENDDPEQALKDALDSKGEFACDAAGIMEFNNFLVFRAIINRQSFRTFTPIRDEHEERKL